MRTVCGHKWAAIVDATTRGPAREVLIYVCRCRIWDTVQCSPLSHELPPRTSIPRLVLDRVA